MGWWVFGLTWLLVSQIFSTSTAVAEMNTVGWRSLLRAFQREERIWWCPLTCECPDSTVAPIPESSMTSWLTEKIHQYNGIPPTFTAVAPSSCSLDVIQRNTIAVTSESLAWLIGSRIVAANTVADALYGEHAAQLASWASAGFQYGGSSWVPVPPQGYVFGVFGSDGSNNLIESGPSLFATALLLASAAGVPGMQQSYIFEKASAAFATTLAHVWSSGMIPETVPNASLPSPDSTTTWTKSVFLLSALNASGALPLPGSDSWLPYEQICFYAKQGAFPFALRSVNGSLEPVIELDASTAAFAVGFGWAHRCGLSPCTVLKPVLDAWGVNRSAAEDVWTSAYVSATGDGVPDVDASMLMVMALAAALKSQPTDTECRSNLTTLLGSMQDGAVPFVCGVPANRTAAELVQRATSSCPGVWLSTAASAITLMQVNGFTIFDLPNRTVTPEPSTVTPQVTPSPGGNTTEAPSTQAPSSLPTATPSTTIPTVQPMTPPTTGSPTPSSTTSPTSTEAAPSTDEPSHDKTVLVSMCSAAGALLVLVVGAVLVRKHRRAKQQEVERLHLLPRTNSGHNMGFF